MVTVEFAAPSCGHTDGRQYYVPAQQIPAGRFGR